MLQFGVQPVVFVMLFVFINGTAEDLSTIGSEKPVSFSGGISLNSTFYHVNGIQKRRSPFSYSISGSPVLTLYGVSVPFSFTYTDEQSSFSQPFNRFGASPHYKWIKLHVGHRSVRFSPYTLAGHNFLGAGIELTPGKFRFGAVYGRFKEAIPEETSLPTDSFLYRQPLPAYERRGYAFKIGAGTPENYIDFIYFKAEDDPGSLTKEPVTYDIEPGENAVFGISKKVTLFESLIWQTDAGLSLYTQNTSLEELTDTVLPVKNLVKPFVEPNISSQLYFAGETSLMFKKKTYSFQVKYKRIDPDYKSMGSYYIQNDIEQYTFAPSFMLFKNKLVLNGSIGFQQDNLYSKKALRTGRTIGSVNASFNPGQKFGMNVAYSNYGFKQNSSGLIDNYADSMLVHQVSQNISVMPRLTFMNEKASHVFFLNVSYQEMRNKNLLNDMVQDMTSVITSLNYNYFHISSGINLTPVVFINSTTVQTGIMRSIGTSLSVAKPFINNRIRSNLMLSYNSNAFDNVNNGYTFNLGGNVHIGLSKNMKHNLNMGVSWIHNNAKSNIESEILESRSFSESTGSIGYSFNF